MYRTTESKRAHCPMCDANALTEPTKVDTYDGNARVVFANHSGGEHRVEMSRGRVCLSCGYVALFLGKKQLEELNRELAELVVVRDPT